MSTTTTRSTTETLKVPGATLTYDVRLGDHSPEPPLLLIGSPMGAAGFGTLAGHFPNRTIVTYDPRGVERSERDDMTSQVNPDIHADDIHRIVEAIGAEPVDVFASSGGAVNALALVAKHPDDVRTLVAHEPPLASVLADRAQAFAGIAAIGDAYRDSGWGVGMASFIAFSMHPGPFTADYLDKPAPDPETFGFPSDDDGVRSDPLLGQNLITCTQYEPDLDVLRTVSTRIVVAAGEQSGQTMASRAAHALADQLGLASILLPGDHGGFLGGEYGQTGDPDAFGPALGEVLAG